MTITLDENTLSAAGAAILSNLPDNVALEADAAGVGAFLRFTAEKAAASHIFALGNLGGIARFTSGHRYEPFWMVPKAGTRGGQVARETQHLLCEREDGTCVLLLPLIDGTLRCALQGAEGDAIELTAESGDPTVVADAVTGLFVAAGADPYELMTASARAVAARLGTCRVRTEKPVPSFVDQFGWCTWDAFYHDVSHDKVREGLESFRAGGVPPKALILDDGWQSVREMPSGEKRLTAFAANEKFPGDLAPTVRMAKEEFGVDQFIVWHAFNGYWGGVDDAALPGYGVQSRPRSYSPGVLSFNESQNGWFGGNVGVVSPEHVYRFFPDYHRHLRQQGVDGVKVDSQASIEGIAGGFGGRVSLMRAYHEALEGSVHVHFRGTLINCMSCANEMFFSALNSNVTRTSTDFWPNKPESHGLHLYTNAQVSALWGEFVFPDWDMFQSGHAMGAFHAAGRAVGGCPVYVSDKPGAHNFDVLRKLVLSDGSVLRADGPGRPTRDCLFVDPTKEKVLLKIFNTNDDSGIVGVFHARYEEGATEPIAGVVRPGDVEGIAGETFAVWSHREEKMRLLGRNEGWDVSVAPLEWDLFTIVPAVDGFAPIGLVDRYNSARAVVEAAWDEEMCLLVLRSGGRFVAWSERTPAAMEADGEVVDFHYDPETGLLDAQIPGDGVVSVGIAFDEE